jgi:hypothetical protein
MDNYNDLPINQRADILWDKGKFYEQWHDYGKGKIVIYLLFDSIVAVYYDDHENKIKDIKMWDKLTAKAEIVASASLN